MAGAGAFQGRIARGERAMTDGSYSVFDHTADVGVEVTAASPEALFEIAASALFELLADTRGVVPRFERAVAVTGADLEELLVRWLSELLYLHDAEGWLFSRFKVSDLSPGRLAGSAAGEPYDAERHLAGTEIKAVTYHQVSVRNEGGRWTARIVFDV